MALIDFNWDPASYVRGTEKEAWKTFYAAVNSLQYKGNREQAGKLFREVAEKFGRIIDMVVLHKILNGHH